MCASCMFVFAAHIVKMIMRSLFVRVFSIYMFCLFICVFFSCSALSALSHHSIPCKTVLLIISEHDKVAGCSQTLLMHDGAFRQKAKQMFPCFSHVGLNAVSYCLLGLFTSRNCFLSYLNSDSVANLISPNFNMLIV